MNHEGETEPVDITEEWFREHPKCVRWKPPIYTTSQCFQTCVVQGLNSAGRLDKNLWYCVSRTGECGASTHQNQLRVNVHARFNTCEEANACEESLYSDKSDTEWSRYSPCLRSFCESDFRWREGVSEHMANKILKQKHVVCIQASMPMKTILYTWIEANTEYLQLYLPTEDKFVNDAPKFSRVQATLMNILRGRTNIFLVGIIDKKMTFYIYDVIAFPKSQPRMRKTNFVHQPLLERLQHIQAIVSAETEQYIGSCVKVAPFQAAATRQDMKLHSRIFIDSCDFPGVICRVSGASGEL